MFVQILPVCNCGHVFEDGIEFHEEVVFADGTAQRNYVPIPRQCPQCGEMISGIQCNGICKISLEKIFIK